MTKPSSILVVDDSHVTRLIHQAALQKAFPDAYVETAKDGIDALQQLSEFKFELVVTDYDMGGITGLELVRKMRANADTLTTRVIGATGNDLFAEFKAAGADGFFLKGLHTDRLIAAVEEIFPPEA